MQISEQNKQLLYKSLIGSGLTIYELYGYGVERIYIGDSYVKSDRKEKLMNAIDITEYVKSNLTGTPLSEWITQSRSQILDVEFYNFSVISKTFD